MLVHTLILEIKSVMSSIGQLLNLWMLICKNVEELDVMDSQLSVFFVCGCTLCTVTKPIDSAISVYSYWDTLHAISGASPHDYAPAIKQALPLIKMAEAPWTCRRIPILSYYNEQPDPAFTCGNCDVCFAADSGSPYTTDIRQDVVNIRELFTGARGHQVDIFTRTELGKKFGSSRHRQRVVEYLVFKGILEELPYMGAYGLNCRIKMVGSKTVEIVY